MRRQSSFPFKKLSRRFDFGNQDSKNIIRVVFEKYMFYTSKYLINFFQEYLQDDLEPSSREIKLSKQESMDLTSFRDISRYEVNFRFFCKYN